MMNVRTIPAAFALALATVATAAIAAPLIENPERAPRQTEVLMREVWRVGAGDDDPVMGPIHRAVTDPAGNVYLLDSQKQEVLKFAVDGRFLGLVARNGQGPGEIDRVYGMEIIDGKRLGLLRGFPPEVIMVGLDGTPLPSLKPGAPAIGGDGTFAMLSSLAFRDGFLVATGQVSRYDGQAQFHTHYVASLAQDGAIRHCYGTHERELDFSRAITVDELAEWSPWQRWALGSGGEVYFVPDRDRWLIEVRDPDGNLLRTIARPGKPHRRNAAEKEAAKDNYSFSSQAKLPPISYRIADTDPAIGGLGYNGRELHVYTGRGGPEVPGTRTFDVLDPEGRLLETRTVRVPGCGPDDGLLLLSDGRALCVKNLEAAMAAWTAGMQVQVGDKIREKGEAEGADLEIIMFTPDGWKPTAPRN